MTSRSSQHPSPKPDDLVSESERRRIVSGFRMALALTVMTTLIVAGLTGLIFLLVSRVLDSLTPALADDLAWKARRGAVELSKTAELGILVGDAEVIRRAARDYISAQDVVNVVAIGPDGQVVFEYGSEVSQVRAVLARPAGAVHHLGDRLVAWAPATIEGEEVGRVAVAVTTARLAAGDALRRQITLAAIGGGVVAMLLALGFLALYVWPVLRLTERTFVRLEQTTHQALAAARLKAQFLANMSHEIRTPMNAVVGLSKLMLEMSLAPKVQRYAERIDVSARALLNIINDILDFSKIEAGKYQIHRASNEVSAVVQDVAELLAERAQAKGIDLVYRIAPEVPRLVEIDADRVRQVLINLVGNAVKFTDKGEVFIEVKAHASGADEVELEVAVHDTGMGVPEEQREHIFESFSQGDGSMVRKHGGTGLGLAISKQLLRLMGGTLSLDSKLGAGSCFTFKLPARVLDGTPAIRAQPGSLGKRALITCDNEHAASALAEHLVAWGMTAAVVKTAADAQAQLGAHADVGPRFDIVLVSETQTGATGAAVATALQELLVKNETPLVLLSQQRGDQTSVTRAPQLTAQLTQPVRMSALYETLSRVFVPGSVRVENQQDSASTRSFKGALVLVVDDNEMNQFVATEQLERLGCQVDRALDGRQAVEAVLAREYAIVLMDCQMPVMDGYTATREIRKHEPEGRHTVIVALTAHALEGERTRVLDAGMDDYMTKPVRPQTLRRTLARWIKHDGIADSKSSEPAPSENEADTFGDCATALLRLFLEKVPAQVEQLDAAAAVEDLEEVRAHAHKLKGSLLTISAHQLASLAQELHHAAETGDTSQIEQTTLALLAGYVELEKRVKTELSSRAQAAKRAAHA